jgi:hypothetical protein
MHPSLPLQTVLKQIYERVYLILVLVLSNLRTVALLNNILHSYLDLCHPTYSYINIHSRTCRINMTQNYRFTSNALPIRFLKMSKLVSCGSTENRLVVGPESPPSPSPDCCCKIIISFD